MLEFMGHPIDEIIDSTVTVKLQRMFCTLTGLRAYAISPNGEHLSAEPYLDNVRYSDAFCKCIRKTETGEKMCHLCDLNGARIIKKVNGPMVKYCHAGLVHFSVPSMVRGEVMCIFAGGHILTKPLTREQVAKTASFFNIDEEELWKASLDIPVMTGEHIRLAAEELFDLAGIISELAESKLMSIESEESLKHADAIKSDFLANMSHEIRTPMNAVIGMSELALREEMNNSVRGYINQIKNSGKALLNIINDILDYSKIESGKLEISEVNYEPMSVINDVSTIIMTRIADKNVELMLNIPPNVPRVLYGDNLRIRQILINLANNAAKFTNEGSITISARVLKHSNPEYINLNFEVRDTGIGIKKEDMSKLFGSFQQLDSKRNRNVEGTGLGLAICKSLVEQMHGAIGVESVYNEGSCFYFTLPQKIVDKRPFVEVANPEKYALALVCESEEMNRDFLRDSLELGLATDIFPTADYLDFAIDKWHGNYEDRECFFIVEETLFEANFDKIREAHLKYPATYFVVLAGPFSDLRKWRDFDFVNSFRKPISTFAISNLINHTENLIEEASLADEGANFVAPDAKILIVDDNPVNLTVSSGLLEPLRMRVDTATSGKDALGKIAECKYNIIFMDHMMPEMDGIETTHIIRRMYPNYLDTPIVALTANAVGGAKEMFLAEGMNDFISKPIELKVLISKVKQWLPPELIKNSVTADEPTQTNDEYPSLSGLTIGDLEIDAARKLLGTDKLYWNVLKEYFRTIESKAAAIEKSFSEADWPAYTIEVHALKSSSRQIGANLLGAIAADMEIAGNERNAKKIEQTTPDMLLKYRSYIALLEPYFEEKKLADEELREIDTETLKACLGEIREAMDDLDMSRVEEICSELAKYRFDEEQKAVYAELKKAAENMDADSCEIILDSWEALL